MSNPPKNYGAIWVLISALMFGSYGVWSRLIGSAMGNFYQGWTRALIILILLVPILLWGKEIKPIHKNDRGWLVIFLIFTSLTQAPIFYAFNHMDIGSASLLFFVTMFLTMNVVGLLFLGEKISGLKIIAGLLALIGMYLVFSFSVKAFIPLAALMAILNGVASGGEVAFSKKLTNTYSPLYVATLSWLIILPTNAILSWLSGETQIIPSLSQLWAWQVGYSLASLLGFWLVIAGFKRVEASTGALLGLLEIVFSICFGILIFKESLSILVAVGGGCIILAAALPHILISKKNIQFVQN